MKPTSVPKPPTELPKIDNEQMDDMRIWIDRIRAVSPEIKVIGYFDNNFQENKKMILGKIDEYLRSNRGHDKIEIQDFNADEICFILCRPESVIGKERTYLTENTAIFCLGDNAFFVEYGIDVVDEKYRPKENAKHVNDKDWWFICAPDYHSWENRLKVFLDHFQKLFQKVPKLERVFPIHGECGVPAHFKTRSDAMFTKFTCPNCGKHIGEDGNEILPYEPEPDDEKDRTDE